MADRSIRCVEPGSSLRLLNRPWVAPAIVFIAALLLYSINLNRPPHPDELHHALAAQHLLETGRPAIGEGEYVRGILHTWMVALSYRIFGESLASARLPAVFFVALLAPLLLVWVRREAGNLAAWLTAILFLSSPFAVEIAQFSRFYGLQMFSFTAGVMCAYFAITMRQPWWRTAALMAAASALFALAVWLQVTTLIGLIGLSLWVAAALVAKFLLPPDLDRSVRKRRLVVALVVAVVLAVLAGIVVGKMQWAIERYRYAPLFAAKSVNEFWYYHLRFVLLYPTLWTLVGVLAIAAVVRNASLGWLAVTVFGVSFVLASFAGQKEMRYFCYAQPFVAMLWGLGLAHVEPALSSWLRGVSHATSRVLVFLALALVLIMNPFWLRTAAVIGSVALPGETPKADWRAARDALSPWIENAEIVVTTEELGAIYFIGRSDVRFSPNKIREIRQGQLREFGIDPRVGLPLVSTTESLEKIMVCFSSGLIVGPIDHWGNPILISEPVQEVIRAHAQPIAMPKKANLYAYGWTRQKPAGRPDFCKSLDRFSGLRAAH